MQQHINLNLIPTGLPPTFYTSAYDVGRIFTITVYEGTETYTVPDDAVVELHATKPDKKAIVYTCTHVGAEISFTTTEQLTAVSGTVDCKIWITEGDNRLGTLKFRLYVDADALPDDADLSVSDLASIQVDIQTAKDAKETAVASAKTAEAAANRAEVAANAKAAFMYYYGLMNTVVEFTYGDDGNIKSLTKTDSSNEDTMTMTFSYNSEGDISSIVSTITTKEKNVYTRTITFVVEDGNTTKITTVYTESEAS